MTVDEIRSLAKPEAYALQITKWPLLALGRPIRPVLLCRELSPERWFDMSGAVQSIANLATSFACG
jgi:hypothetical protein